MIAITVAVYGTGGFVKKRQFCEKNNQFILAYGKIFISNENVSDVRRFPALKHSWGIKA